MSSKKVMKKDMLKKETFLFFVLAAPLVFLMQGCGEPTIPQPKCSGCVSISRLESKMEKDWGMLHEKLWIPVVKGTNGPFMYYGDSRYTGKVVQRFNRRVIQYTGEYCDGLPCGTWIYYYENGAKKAMVTRSTSSECEQTRTEYAMDGSVTRKDERIGCELVKQENFEPGTKWE
jgi:hypothetical protein